MIYIYTQISVPLTSDGYVPASICLFVCLFSIGRPKDY